MPIDYPCTTILFSYTIHITMIILYSIQLILTVRCLHTSPLQSLVYDSIVSCKRAQN